MPEFICSTVIEFSDRLEGQVMHIGDEKSCRGVADMIPAVSVSGDETPISARVVVAPAEDFEGIENGGLWRWKKDTADADA